MTVTIDGVKLTIEGVVRVARLGAMAAMKRQPFQQKRVKKFLRRAPSSIKIGCMMTRL